jgi:hypothetical protein
MSTSWFSGAGLRADDSAICGAWRNGAVTLHARRQLAQAMTGSQRLEGQQLTAQGSSESFA